ncbi:MAG: class I SAM-dependent methyltransferase [Candidatus Aminicenantes bacterium]|nr:class I SAM-dependent methyltransferase [Candidatus Aminicenantes bacterium]
MPHKFEVARFKRLMSAERRKELPPKLVLGEIGLRPGQVFVDIGAGPGFFALPASAIVGPGGRVIGLDVSPVMVDELRKNAALKKAANIRTRTIPETGADFPAGADFYFLANVFHEIDDRTAYLRRIRSRMTARSRLVLIDFLKKKTKHGPPLRDRIPLRTIRSLLVASGFTVVRIFRPNEEEYGVVARRA